MSEIYTLKRAQKLKRAKNKHAKNVGSALRYSLKEVIVFSNKMYSIACVAGKAEDRDMSDKAFCECHVHGSNCSRCRTPHEEAEYWAKYNEEHTPNVAPMDASEDTVSISKESAEGLLILSTSSVELLNSMMSITKSQPNDEYRRAISANRELKQVLEASNEQ